MKARFRDVHCAALAAAVAGSASLVLLALHAPPPLVAWMRIIVARTRYPPPLELAWEVAAFFLVAAAFLLAAILAVHRVLTRLGVANPAVALAAILALAFAAAFAGEAISQVGRARGNLTASDATGLIIDQGALTAHGWGTVARRAAAASLYAAMVAAAFRLARRVLAARARRQARGDARSAA